VSRRGLVALALSTLLLAGCFTGQRPYFNAEGAFPPGTTTGDPSIDAVLNKIDTATTGPATAAYSILTKFGNKTVAGTVVLEPGKRSVTVGNTRYIQTETQAATCTEDDSQPCVNAFDPQRISDTAVTVDFYAADTAKRMRRDAEAKIGPAVLHTGTIAGQPVTCVDVPLPGGTAVYCALDNGLVAKVDDGDVLITLTLYGEVVDENAFVIP
jgi:hypothetical protein